MGKVSLVLIRCRPSACALAILVPVRFLVAVNALPAPGQGPAACYRGRTAADRPVFFPTFKSINPGPTPPTRSVPRPAGRFPGLQRRRIGTAIPEGLRATECRRYGPVLNQHSNASQVPASGRDGIAGHPLEELDGEVSRGGGPLPEAGALLHRAGPALRDCQGLIPDRTDDRIPPSRALGFWLKFRSRSPASRSRNTSHLLGRRPAREFCSGLFQAFWRWRPEGISLASWVWARTTRAARMRRTPRQTP